MEPKTLVTEQFTKLFNEQPQKFIMSPGRVNLIGEHTDYNGGYVFPCALDFGTYGAVSKRDDNLIRLASGNLTQCCDVKLEDIKYDADHGWANYPKGVVSEILKLGHKLGGFNLFMWGNIPNASGLSSSASIEMLTAMAINEMFDCGISTKEMALLCQRVENNFVGVNCGIMDQYAVAFGKKDHAILLNCQVPSHEYVPLNLGDYLIMIANTNKSRGLADSKYNERRAECEAAEKILGVSHLCELDAPSFEAKKHLITDPVILNRANHAVYENARTVEAVKVLNAGDLHTFGKLMNESHVSLRDLYEVTGDELDALVEAAWKVDGVLGSRMTGAGFGGCTVSILHKSAVDKFKEAVGKEYTDKTGLTADFYMANVGEGTRMI